MDIQQLLSSILRTGGTPTPDLPSIPIPRAKPSMQAHMSQPAGLPALPGIGDRVGDAFSGVAGIRPGDSAMSAFAQGYSGARQSRNDRSEAEEEKASRAAAAKAAEHQQKFENQLALDDARRAQTRARFDNLKTASDIDHQQRENDDGISTEAMAEIEKRANDYRAILAGKYDRLLVEGEDPETIRTSIEELVEADRQRQIAAIRGGGSLADTGPVGPKGTEQNPYTPMSVADLESVPTGAVYLNPADGQPYRKK